MSDHPASAGIAELRANWARFDDLDRSDAIFAIRQFGVSLRQLASELNCSASLLRHLLRARQASAEDRYLARQNLISTRELVRRSRADRVSPPPQTYEAAEFERARAALETSKEIRAWLSREQIDVDDRMQVILQARELICSAEQNGTMPRHRPPVGTTAEEIVAQCHPPPPKPNGPEGVSWYGRWLANWLAYYVSDSQIRNRALELAEQEPGGQ